MEPIFERGDRANPRGHALLYFRSARDPGEVWATYVVVPPIQMDLSKYVPPMFASQLPMQMPSGPNAFPLPPLPEQVASVAWLEAVATARDDDLLNGGSVDPADMQRLMLAMVEAAQGYGALCGDWARRVPEPEPEPLPTEVDVDDLFYSLMSDRERISKLAKLLGTLRYAIEGADARTAEETSREMEKVGRYLDAKYRAEPLIAAARQPGEAGLRLAQLYVERAYRVAAEDYGALEGLEQQISQLESARGQAGG
jgi:hypothetical protein